jgi:hypothetical protein
MPRLNPLFLSGVCLAIALGGFTAGLQVSAASAGDDSGAAVEMSVNRALKGDRLPVLSVSKQTSTSKQSSSSKTPTEATQRLPDGCEAAVSSTVDSPLARIPSRCVS